MLWSNKWRWLLCCGVLLSARNVHAQSVTTVLTHMEPLVSAVMDGDRLLVVGEQFVEWHAVSGGTMQRVARYDGTIHDQFLRGDLLDITGDGRAEILITNLRANRLQSFILAQTSGNTWHVLQKGLPWYFRVVHDRQLLGQHRGAHDTYRGHVFELAWRNTLVRGSRLDLPRRTSLYHFRQLTDGRVVRTMHDGRHRVWVRDDRRWRVAQTLPREWSGLAAQSVPAATALHGGAIAEPQYFGLTPVYDDAEWMVAKQRPRLGLMVGRTAYWKDWEFVRTTLPDDAVALTQPTWRLPGRGALVEVRDQQASVLLTVQLGRDDPLMRHARKSQVLRIRK